MKTLILFFITAFIIGMSSTTVQAQQDLTGIQFYLFSDELQLSEDQKQEITEILKTEFDKPRARFDQRQGDRNRFDRTRGDNRRHGQYMARTRFWSGVPGEVLDILDEEQRDKLENLIEERQIERRKMRGYMMQSRIEEMGSELGFSDDQISELKQLYFNRIMETDTERRSRGKRRPVAPVDPDFNKKLNEILDQSEQRLWHYKWKTERSRGKAQFGERRTPRRWNRN